MQIQWSYTNSYTYRNIRSLICSHKLVVISENAENQCHQVSTIASITQILAPNTTHHWGGKAQLLREITGSNSMTKIGNTQDQHFVVQFGSRKVHIDT